MAEFDHSFRLQRSLTNVSTDEPGSVYLNQMSAPKDTQSMTDLGEQTSYCCFPGTGVSRKNEMVCHIGRGQPGFKPLFLCVHQIYERTHLPLYGIQPYKVI